MGNSVSCICRVPQELVDHLPVNGDVSLGDVLGLVEVVDAYCKEHGVHQRYKDKGAGVEVNG